MRTRPDSISARMSRSARTLKAWSGLHPSRVVTVVVARRVERVDLALEVLEILEALVHGRETDVGDLIERAKLLHGQLPHPRAGDLGDAAAAQLGLDLVGRLLGRRIGHGAAGQRLAQAGRQLVTIELLAAPVTLGDDEARRLGPLVRREPDAADGALPAPPDRAPVVEVA